MNSQNENRNKIKMLSKKNPAGIFSLVYIYIIIVGFIIALVYSFNIGNIARQSVPPPIPDSTGLENLTIQEAKIVPPVDLKVISKSTPELVSKGKELFETTCISCHGADGKGKGPAAAGLTPPPRNFTSKEEWVNGPALAGIFQTISDGIPGTGMISYDNYTPEEKFALAHYIRTEFVPDPPEVNGDNLAALDQVYNLSEGTEIPAQIPVESAMKIIVEEGRQRVDHVYDIIKKINGETNNSAVQIFNKVTRDKIRAITTLSSSDGWKGNEQRFVNIIVNNVKTNGFNNDVFYLSKKDWTQLYNYMRSNL